MSQARLAGALGLTQPVISRIETGLRQPSVDEVAQLAAALEVPMADLIGSERTVSMRIRVRASIDRRSRLSVSQQIAETIEEGELRAALDAGVTLRSIGLARLGIQPLAATEVAALCRAGLVSFESLGGHVRGCVRIT